MKLADLSHSDIKNVGFKPLYCTMGGDPEFFVAEKRTKRILSADKFFPGKHNPIEVKAHAYNSKLFFDGIQAEAAIAHNVCREYLTNNAGWVFEEVIKRIGNDHEIVIKPATRVQRSVINAADPEARRFGCAPDFNAYTLSVNTSEMDASRHPFRYAGGHIHLGMSSKYLKEGDPEWEVAKREENHLRVIKLMDLLLSIVTLPLDNATGSKRRRDKYGKAGCFRPTPYGIEYRTQSCWWLKSPITMSLVYGLARMAWNAVVKDRDKLFFKLAHTDETEVRGAIDSSDIPTAKKIWENLRPYMAVAGDQIYNPLHLRSVTTHDFDFPRPPQSTKERSEIPKMYGTKVHSLALFEYIVKNGLDSIVNKSPKVEWEKYGWSGLLTGGYKRVEKNKDFFAFQTDFLENVL